MIPHLKNKNIWALLWTALIYTPEIFLNFTQGYIGCNASNLNYSVRNITTFRRKPKLDETEVYCLETETLV